MYNMMRRPRGVILSLFIASCLTIMPVTTWMTWLWPAWVLLVLIYWLVFFPDHIGMVWAFTTGVIVDLLIGPVLGLHALLYTVLAFIILQFYGGIQSMLPMQKVMWIGLVEAIFLLIEHRVGSGNHAIAQTWFHYIPIVTTPLSSLWIFPLLQRMQQYRSHLQ